MTVLIFPIFLLLFAHEEEKMSRFVLTCSLFDLCVFRVYVSVSCCGRSCPSLVKTFDSRDCSLSTRISWSCCATNSTRCYTDRNWQTHTDLKQFGLPRLSSGKLWLLSSTWNAALAQTWKTRPGCLLRTLTSAGPQLFERWDFSVLSFTRQFFFPGFQFQFSSPVFIPSKCDLFDLCTSCPPNHEPRKGNSREMVIETVIRCSISSCMESFSEVLERDQR